MAKSIVVGQFEAHLHLIILHLVLPLKRLMIFLIKFLIGFTSFIMIFFIYKLSFSMLFHQTEAKSPQSTLLLLHLIVDTSAVVRNTESEDRENPQIYRENSYREFLSIKNDSSSLNKHSTSVPLKLFK